MLIPRLKADPSAPVKRTEALFDKIAGAAVRPRVVGESKLHATRVVDAANLVPRMAMRARGLPEGPALAETGYFQRTRMAPISR